MGFVPNFQSVNYDYPVLWVDYTKFQQTVLPTLAINQTTTNNDSWSSDYFYKEQLFAAYVSAKYGWRKTTLIAGVRYDKVDYDARSPLAVAGTYNGTFTPSGGTWENALPSAILTHYFTPRFRAKAAVSQSLGRPQFGEIAQAVVRNDQNLTITPIMRSTLPVASTCDGVRSGVTDDVAASLKSARVPSDVDVVAGRFG